ncbi:hypothetical protein D3C81_1654530 [compost metagenome]
MQRAHARVAAPGENQFAGATGADQLVVDQVRCHPHQRQIFLALTNDFMTRCCRDQVSEAFECDGVTVVDELLHRVVQRKDLSHGAGSCFCNESPVIKRREVQRRSHCRLSLGKSPNNPIID